MANGLNSSVVTVVFPIVVAGWAVCAVGWVWELYKSHRRRLDSRVMTSPSTDGLFQAVEGRSRLGSRASSLLPTIATSPTTPDMRSLELPVAVRDGRVIIDIPALPSTDSDDRPPFIIPDNSHFPSINANQRPQADAPPPDTPTSIPSSSADAISLVSSSTVPPSYHTRRSSHDLQFFPISPPVPLGSPRESPTPPPALVPDRRARQSRVRGPRSRATSRTLLQCMEQSHPPPLPRAMTGGGNPFADAWTDIARAGGNVAEGQSAGDRRPQQRQAVDGGVRLAGGPLDNGGFVGERWDYLLSSPV